MNEFGLNGEKMYKGFMITSFAVNTEDYDKSTFFVTYGANDIVTERDEKYLLNTGEIVQWNVFSVNRNNLLEEDRESLEFHIGLGNTKSTIDKFIDDNPEYGI